MFKYSPQEFATLRTAIHERELERLRAKHDNPRIDSFYQQLKTELESEFQKARERLEAGWDVSYVRVDCFVAGYNDEEEDIVAHKLLKELTEAGFKADLQYSDDGLDGPNFSARYRSLLVALTGV